MFHIKPELDVGLSLKEVDMICCLYELLTVPRNVLKSKHGTRLTVLLAVGMIPPHNGIDPIRYRIRSRSRSSNKVMPVIIIREV
jgi:hypothetical protein